jgi:hypothetical protein
MREFYRKGRGRKADLAKQVHSLGGENDSPSRNISRYLDSLADRLKIGLDVRQIWRTDRFQRGGDHIPFLEAGYPAARISVAVENYDWQHQDVRTVAGHHFGDTIDHVDFAYLAKMTKLNVAALASIASAPPPPEPKVEGAVSTDTTIRWAPVKGAERYVVRWRSTDANQWQEAGFKRMNQLEQAGVEDVREQGVPDFIATMKGIRVDDWIFGVSSVSKDGFESPVASAVPGGAFKPYVAPPPKTSP